MPIFDTPPAFLSRVYIFALSRTRRNANEWRTANGTHLERRSANGALRHYHFCSCSGCGPTSRNENSWGLKEPCSRYSCASVSGLLIR